MSPLRRLLIVLGLLILVASLCLLIVANLPNEHLQDRQSLPPDDLSLPTPEAFNDADSPALMLIYEPIRASF